MINKELLLAAWLEKLQKKWDTEEYYYDVEEKGYCGMVRSGTGIQSRCSSVKTEKRGGVRI